MLHWLYRATGIAGMAIVLLSWLGVVSPVTGLVAFWIAFIAAFLSYLPSRSERRRRGAAEESREKASD